MRYQNSATVPAGMPVRPAGADGRAILADAGYADGKIDALIRQGTVAEA